MGISWPEPDRVLEAKGDGPTRRAQRANRAAQEIIRDFHSVERGVIGQLQRRLLALQKALRSRLIPDLTEFRQLSLAGLLADTDRMVDAATQDITNSTERPIRRAAELGDDAATEPLKAAQLSVAPTLLGVDETLVQAAFGNTVDLLSDPMRQFATQVKQGIRRVAAAGETRFEEIRRLQRSISSAGFDNAQYRAERIIRTEVSRVFNESTYARLSGLQKDFPFLKKSWRAANDNRTRMGHREAAQHFGKGNGIAITQAFSINVYDERPGKAPRKIGVAVLRFPVDPRVTPTGRIGAGATIMCRCNAVVDLDMAAFAEFTRAQVRLALSA